MAKITSLESIIDNLLLSIVSPKVGREKAEKYVIQRHLSHSAERQKKRRRDLLPVVTSAHSSPRHWLEFTVLLPLLIARFTCHRQRSQTSLPCRLPALKFKSVSPKNKKDRQNLSFCIRRRRDLLPVVTSVHSSPKNGSNSPCYCHSLLLA